MTSTSSRTLGAFPLLHVVTGRFPELNKGKILLLSVLEQIGFFCLQLGNVRCTWREIYKSRWHQKGHLLDIRLFTGWTCLVGWRIPSPYCLKDQDQHFKQQMNQWQSYVDRRFSQLLPLQILLSSKELSSSKFQPFDEYNPTQNWQNVPYSYHLTITPQYIHLFFNFRLSTTTHHKPGFNHLPRFLVSSKQQSSFLTRNFIVIFFSSSKRCFAIHSYNFKNARQYS